MSRRGTKTKVYIVIGQTATGFNRWLKWKGLTVPKTEDLANLVHKALKAYERDKREGGYEHAKLVVKELWQLCRAVEADDKLKVELTRRFGRLLDTYRTLITLVSGKKL